MRRVAIVQSNYIPWKGYFDMMRQVDVFILLDNVQYTRRDWRNRNRIKTPHGLQWLSIPVRVESRDQLICETHTIDQVWRRKHWAAIELSYAKAPWFAHYAPQFCALYLDDNETRLSRINRRFIEAVNRVLGIETAVHWAWEFEASGRKTERLVALCRAVGADVYLSGPSAKAYIDPALFTRAGIELRWMRYEGYREYPQLHGAFEHSVTVLDLIFNAGPDAVDYML